jgi:hypothetical protein
MCSPTRLARLMAVTMFALALAACAPPLKVNSYVERGIDFNRYHTYNWDPADSLFTGDPRLDANPFFHSRIKADVEKQLAARGFEKTASGTPDLLVHYHESINQRMDVNGIDRSNGYCQSDDCRPFVYDAGTLVLDFVDTRTKKLVWRGWAEGSMDGLIDNQDWMDQKIDDDVTRILNTLPPKL